MTDKLVAAMTPNGGYTYYPPFINVKRRGNTVVVMLRGNEVAGERCGGEAVATFPAADFAKFLDEAKSGLSE